MRTPAWLSIMLAVYAGECLDLLHTGEALAFGFSAFLRQLRSRERLCQP